MKVRRAVRALLVTPDEKLLLMKLQLSRPDRSFWIAPGGGVAERESAETALLRELDEETGNPRISIGPVVWLRSHDFELDGEMIRQQEEFYFCPTAEFEAVPRKLEEGLERDGFRELRWWPLSQIGRSNERFVPQSLAVELAKLLCDGFPTSPIQVGH